LVKKKENTKEEIQESDLKELIDILKPLIEVIAPNYIEYQKIKAPLIERSQIINFLIMISILASITLLAYLKIIDGSAATGLIGAIIGYVFGGLYQNRNNRR